MNTTRHPTLLLLLIVALITIPTSLVAAKELNSLTISGPGIDGTFTLNDPEELMDLEQSGFFFQSKTTKPPENIGTGYQVTVYLNLDGDIVPTIQLDYYPGAKGQQGYVHYTGLFNGTELETADEWNLLPEEAEIPFLKLMASKGITLQPAVFAPPVSETIAEAAVVAPVAEVPAVVEPIAESVMVEEPAVDAQVVSQPLVEVEKVQPPVTNDAAVQPSAPTFSPSPAPTIYAGLLLAGIAMIFVFAVVVLKRRTPNHREAEAGD